MVAIAIANQKGGVGKTTVTLGLAEAAAKRGLRVLVVDCDPQANASAGFGVDTSGRTLSDVLEHEVILDLHNRADYVFESSWTNAIEVLPADGRLGSIETHLAADPIGAFDRMSIALAGITSRYDVIFFDCPPSLGLLTINALFAADEVIVVSAPSAWSYDGVETFSKNVARIAQRQGGKPRITGVIINNVLRTRDAQYWQNEIQDHFTFPLVAISARAAVAEASAASSSLSRMRSRKGAAESLAEFDEAFLSLVGIADSSSPPVATTQERARIKARSIASAL